MQESINNADVVRKFILRYLSTHLTDNIWNILTTITHRDVFNKIIELKKSLNNVSIILINVITVP